MCHAGKYPLEKKLHTEWYEFKSYAYFFHWGWIITTAYTAFVSVRQHIIIRFAYDYSMATSQRYIIQWIDELNNDLSKPDTNPYIDRYSAKYRFTSGVYLGTFAVNQHVELSILVYIHLPQNYVIHTVNQSPLLSGEVGIHHVKPRKGSYYANAIRHFQLFKCLLFTRECL